MCGIVGFWDYSGRGFAPSSSILEHMTETLAHRGPDSRGSFFNDRVGLGHRRLKILDLSEAAGQPMSSPDGTVRIVYNGELYNFRELRSELERLDHSFSTSSDTEVLLHCYLEWGVDCINRFNGIFAFALWDERKERLWLVRDHFGVKPLFYSDFNGTLLFASELRALLAWPEFRSKPDYFALDAYFTFGYIPAPFTRFHHVRQLFPGQWLTVDRNGIRVKKYWDIDFEADKLQGDDRELTEEFERVLDSAIRRQMVSDVPLGAFLSSGTDSFAVVRSMKRSSKNKVAAYSIGFNEKGYNELQDTKLAAKVLGVKLVHEYFESSERLMEDVAHHCWEGFADSSSLAVYQLCKMAVKDVKVSLSGDGADELLAGYETYRATKLARRFRALPMMVRKGISMLAKAVPESGARYSLKEKSRRFIHGAGNEKWRDHASWRVIFPDELKKKIYTPDFYDEIKEFDPLELYAEPMRKAESYDLDPLDCMLYADLAFYLPNDMLVKVDRMSMAHGLEVRVPFLDREVVDFAWRLPVSLKHDGHISKRVLRKAISSEYPEVLCSKAKQGFNVPASIIHACAGQITKNETHELLRYYKSIRMDKYQAFSLYVFENLDV